MRDGVLDAALDLTERLLERGIVLVLQLRRTPSGKRLTIGVGLLDSTDALLLGAAAERLLRRRRRHAAHDEERRRSTYDDPRPDWSQDPMEEL